MPMRALVTGAYGFLGRHLARYLSGHGWEVTGLGHGYWPREEWASWGLSRWISGSVEAATLASAGVQDAAFHCAGGSSVRFATENPYEDFTRTVASTASLVEWSRTQSGRAAVVMVSSAAVYGSTGSDPVREDRAPRPQSVYAAHKLMAEDLCRLYARTFSIRCTIVRLFSVYGPGLKKQLLWDACNKLTGGDRTFAGTGGEERDWVHVEDAARLVAIGAEHAGADCPVVNGGLGTAVPVRDVVALVATSLAAPLPTFGGDVRQGDPHRLVADPSLAHGWGWRPSVGWREGIREYCEWFEEKGGPRRG